MTLDPDEIAVFDYLKSWPKQFVSAAEVCRRAGGQRRYRQDPNWAYPVLTRLLDKRIVETDSDNRYRPIPVKEKEARKRRTVRYVSPQIRAILENSGKVFDLKDPDEPEEDRY